MKRNVLGKGIAAIISNEPAPQNQLIEIAVEDIYPNPHQPRKNFSQEKIQELADSMKESGIIQPVVVFKKSGKYYLLVGERRWRAAQLLKWGKIQAVVRDVSDDEIVVDSLVENIQRENLNAIEVAEGIEILIKKINLSQQQVAEKLGLNRVTVTNFLRLLKLPEQVKKNIINGELDQGHARALLSLQNDEHILRAATQIIKKKLSVRQAEKLVRVFLKEKKKLGKPSDPDLIKIENKLTKLFSTKVKLVCSLSGKGKIEIFFNSLEEFDRINSILNKE